jgi:ABC-type glutathione transport system ATPase component
MRLIRACIANLFQTDQFMTDNTQSSGKPSQLITDESEVLLQIRDLHTSFYTHDGVVKAVDGVSFEVHRGEILGLVANRAAVRV